MVKKKGELLEIYSVTFCKHPHQLVAIQSLGMHAQGLATNTDSLSFLHRIFSRGLPSPNQLIFAWQGRCSTIRDKVKARLDCMPEAMS